MNSHGDNINEALAHFLIVEKKIFKNFENDQQSSPYELIYFSKSQ